MANSLEIRFYCVGRADTIILRWDDDKVGIIDCASAEKVKDYLDAFKERFGKDPEIVFCAVTHFHADHIRGFTELLQHFKANKLQVKYFYQHSITILTAHELISMDENARKNNIENDSLSNMELLLATIIELQEKSETICKTILISEDVRKDFGDFYLLFLAPGVAEMHEYIKKSEKTDPETGENVEKGKLRHNFLSAVTMLVRKQQDKYCLLTGDAESTTLERLDIEKFDYVEPQKTFQMRLVCAQVPHHGSIENWAEGFWKSRKIERIKTEAVISAGGNKDEKHPSIEVMKNLEKIGYDVKMSCALPENYGKAKATLPITAAAKTVFAPGKERRTDHEYCMTLGED